MNPSALVSEDPKGSVKTALLRLATDIRHDLHHVLGSLDGIFAEPLSAGQLESILRYYACTDQLLRAANDLSKLAEANSPEQADFELPFSGPQQRSLPAPELRAARLRILVAEDSDDSFAVFQAFIGSEGHQVTRVLDGAQAAALVKSGGFDILIMDVNMPVMDGYTATRMIRDWEKELGRDALPIVLLSADDAKTQLRMGAAAGCSSYLVKPTPKAELIRVLRYYAAGA